MGMANSRERVRALLRERGNTMRYKFIPIILLFIFIAGCCKSNEADKKEIVAYVNKEPVYESDLKRDLALRAQRDPAFKYTPQTRDEQLNLIIDRKLVIKEAMDKGLARSERFANTIKTFWEQTLIRDFLDVKRQEFKNKVSVTDDEIRKYYDKLSDRVTFRILKSTDGSYIDDVHDKFIKNEVVSAIPFETVGPVGYDGIGADILLEAFEQSAGEAKKYTKRPDYYLIVVDEREKREVEPFENIKDIEKRIIAGKEARLFEDWLSQKRKQAKIKIITK